MAESDREKAEYAPEVELKHNVADDQSWETEFTPEERKAIIWRIDRRLVTTVGIMYCVSLMDRTNLSAANIAGMSTELLLVGDRYSVISLVFFTTYIVFQPPSTVIIRKIGPRIHLAVITTLWGAVMIGFGFVQQWQQLAALRVLLGILEAGFFPSCVYLLSTWVRFCRRCYAWFLADTRYEVGKRYSFFYIHGMSFAAFVRASGRT